MPPMLATLKTFSLLGIDALPVEVEVDVATAGLPKVMRVGTELTVLLVSRDAFQASECVIPWKTSVGNSSSSFSFR